MTFNTAARNCYQSLNDKTDNIESAEALARKLIAIGHGSPIEMNNITFRFVGDRNFLGQLSRHRLLSLCVSGDTVIPSFSGCKKRTIKDLYKMYTTSTLSGPFKATVLRSLDEETHTIVPNKPVKVFYNGVKPVYKVVTESGREIKTTIEHRFLSAASGKWERLKDLSVGDYVLVNGKDLLDNEDWLRYNYLERNLTRKEVANLVGCCEAYVYRAFKKFGIRKPYKDMPNRKPGHGVKGMFSKETLQEMSERASGSNNYRWKTDRNDLTAGGGYAEAHRLYDGVKKHCEFCNTTDNIEIHHIDKNPRHNDASNIKFLCSTCHRLWHRHNQIGAFNDKIVSIEYVGEEDVYDIEMENPHHNYVANGFVVHNCVESARYCNYSKGKFNHSVSFVKPLGIVTEEQEKIWEESCKKSEEDYFKLLDAGCAPETARSVLNTSLATHIIASGNIREWRHVIELRCDTHAQQDIRALITTALKLLYEHYPVFFEDLYAKYVK